MNQPSLFDSPPERAKVKAIERVEANNREFVELAYYNLVSLIDRRPTITSLDVWREMKNCITCDAVLPTNPRAIGPVFVRARHAGLISPTNSWVPSGRTSDHNQQLRVWKSEVYRG